MAHYLVRGKPVPEYEQELQKKVKNEDFKSLKPFGESLTQSLRSARKDDDGYWVWEELDFCSPPLQQERETVLDTYFRRLEIEPVEEGEGWRRIEGLNPIFPPESRQYYQGYA